MSVRREGEVEVHSPFVPTVIRHRGYLQDASRRLEQGTQGAPGFPSAVRIGDASD